MSVQQTFPIHCMYSIFSIFYSLYIYIHCHHHYSAEYYTLAVNHDGGDQDQFLSGYVYHDQSDSLVYTLDYSTQCQSQSTCIPDSYLDNQKPLMQLSLTNYCTLNTNMNSYVRVSAFQYFLHSSRHILSQILPSISSWEMHLTRIVSRLKVT